jgi:cytochrome c oxidase subunit 3
MSATAIRPAAHFASAEQQSLAASLGMWVFLATELMFFGPLFLAYAYGRMHYGDAYPVASRHTEVIIGTVNTALLLTSSACMAAAVAARRANAGRIVRFLLYATAALGCTFLVLKGVEYAIEWREGLVPALHFTYGGHDAAGVEHFFYLYFAMTLLHALHLTIGVVIVLVFAVALARGAEAFANPERLETAALYWHFVDSVWIFLYPLIYLVGRSAA